MQFSSLLNLARSGGFPIMVARASRTAKAALAGTIAVGALGVSSAGASVIVDNSPAALGTAPNQFSANDSYGSNFLVEFTLNSPGYIDGFSIFTFNTSPSDVTIKLRADNGGVPASSNLQTFTETASFDHVETVRPDVYRATASFAPIDLAAGSYWIGLSQTAINHGSDPELGWLSYRPTSATDHGQYNLRGDTLSGPFVGLAFQLDGGTRVSSVPLPASAPMFGAALVAFGAAGFGMKRSRSNTRAAG